MDKFTDYIAFLRNSSRDWSRKFPCALSMNLAEVKIVLSEDNYGFALKKGNDKLKTRLEKALDEVVADGTYEKIYNKWFGPMMKK